MVYRHGGEPCAAQQRAYARHDHPEFRTGDCVVSGVPDLDNDNDGIADTRDACPNEAEDFDNFEDRDTINFKIQSARNGDPLTFQGPRAEFDQFIRNNADELRAILFPTSISEGLTGTDAPRGQRHR